MAIFLQSSLMFASKATLYLRSRP